MDWTRFRHKRFSGTVVLMLVAVFVVALVAAHHRLPWTTESSKGGYAQAGAGAPKKLAVHGGRQLKESVNANRRDLEEFPSQLITPPTEPPEMGYIIIERMDKTPLDTAPELLNIQCWAESMKMQVVEPSLRNNTLITPLSPTPPSNILKYENLYNYIDLWPLDKEYGRLITLDDIDLKDITDAIIVDVAKEYSQSSKLSQNCVSSEYRQNSHFGLNVAQELCFSTQQPTAQILEEIGNFVGFLQSQHKATKVLVIVRRWVGDEYQNMKQCSGDRSNAINVITPSTSIMSDADAFIKARFSGKFLAVVLTSEVRRSQSLSSCLERTLTQLHSLKMANNTTNLFLTLQFKKAHGLSMTLQFKTFFRALYHKTHQLEKWQKEVSEASSIKEETYEMLLAQVVATKAECLVMPSDRYLPDYLRHYLRRQPSSCVITVPECQESFTPQS